MLTAAEGARLALEAALAGDLSVQALKENGLRTDVKVMIGGAPTTRAWADGIGADGYFADVIEAVATAKGLLGVG